MHEIITTILVCGIFSILYIIYIRNKFSHERSKYHGKTIKLYLNYQFTAKILHHLQAPHAYDTIIKAIKEYFLLDEIAIFKYVGKLQSNEQISHEAAKYIQNNIKNIISALDHQEYIFLTINVEDNPRDIVVQCLDGEKKLFVLYSTNMDNKLSKDDIEMITSIVIPILNLSIMLPKNESLKYGEENSKNGGC